MADKTKSLKLNINVDSKRADQALDKTAKKTTTLSKSATTAAGATTKLGGSLGTAGAAATTSTGAITGLNASLGRLAVSMAPIAATFAGLFAVKGLITGATAFEDTLIRIRATSQFTGIELLKIEASIKDIAASNTTSLAEVSRNFTIASSRITQFKDDLDEATKATLALTQASTLFFDESESTSRALADIINAFQASGDEALAYVAILANLQRQSNLTLEALPGLARVAGLAASVGVSFDQVAFSFRALSEAGIRTRQVASNLELILRKVAETGTSFEDILSMTNEELGTAGLRSYIAYIDILREAQAAQGDFADSIRDTGTLTEVLALRAEATSGKWSDLTTAIETFSTSLSGLQPVFVGVLSTLTSIINLLTALPNLVGNITRTISPGLTPALGPQEETEEEILARWGRRRRNVIAGDSSALRTPLEEVSSALQQVQVQGEEAAAAVTKVGASTRVMATGLNQLVGGVVGVVAGGTSALASFGSTLSSIATNILSQLAQIQVIRGLTGLFPGSEVVQALGAGAGLTPRAMGGPVAAGRPYLVGEQGPELFIPSSSGTIDPNRTRVRDVNITINEGNRPIDRAELINELEVKMDERFRDRGLD